MEKTGITKRVREAMQRYDSFNTKNIADALEIRTYREQKPIRNTIVDMLKSGEIERIGKGVYRYNFTWEARRGVVERNILRAMYIKGSFSNAGVALLTDADFSYVCSVVRGLIAAGDIEKAGRTRSATGQPMACFQVRNRDEFYLKHINPASSLTMP